MKTQKVLNVSVGLVFIFFLLVAILVSEEPVVLGDRVELQKIAGGGGMARVSVEAMDHRDKWGKDLKRFQQR